MRQVQPQTPAELQELVRRQARLLSEIRSEERYEIADVDHLRNRMALAEVEERDHRQASLAQSEARQKAEARMFATVGDKQSVVQALDRGTGHSAGALAAEIRAMRGELAAAQGMAVQQEAHQASAQRQVLAEWVARIHACAQENQALEANQQMARAHMKALAAMAVSSVAQAKTRENSLFGLLAQVEEQESASFDLTERTEVAEMSLQTLQFLPSSANSAFEAIISEEVSEFEHMQNERSHLQLEVRRLEQEVHSAHAGMQALGEGSTLHADGGLLASMAHLRGACKATEYAVIEASRVPSRLEMQLSTLDAELVEERRSAEAQEEVQEELRLQRLSAEELRGVLRGAVPGRHRGSIRAAMATTRLEAEMSGNSRDIAREVDLAREEGELLVQEQEEMLADLEDRQENCDILRLEAAERDDQFRCIMTDLQAQVTSLRSEEKELRGANLAGPTEQPELHRTEAAMAMTPAHPHTVFTGSAGLHPSLGPSPNMSAIAQTPGNVPHTQEDLAKWLWSKPGMPLCHYHEELAGINRNGPSGTASSSVPLVTTPAYESLYTPSHANAWAPQGGESSAASTSYPNMNSEIPWSPSRVAGRVIADFGADVSRPPGRIADPGAPDIRPPPPRRNRWPTQQPMALSEREPTSDIAGLSGMGSGTEFPMPAWLLKAAAQELATQQQPQWHGSANDFLMRTGTESPFVGSSQDFWRRTGIETPFVGASASHAALFPREPLANAYPFTPSTLERPWYSTASPPAGLWPDNSPNPTTSASVTPQGEPRSMGFQDCIDDLKSVIGANLRSFDQEKASEQRLTALGAGGPPIASPPSRISRPW